jgi:tetratricopeptide (TPR) repeat protein
MTKAHSLLFLLLLGACRHAMPAAPAKTAAQLNLLVRPQPSLPCLPEIAEAQKATAARPDDAQAWSQLSMAFGHANRLQEAVRAAWRSIELAPTAEAWTALGYLFMQGGAPNGAIAAFEEASRQTSDSFLSAQNFINLGYHAWQWGMDDLAARVYARADELAPGHPQIQYHRIMMLASSGQRQAAQAEATKLRNVIDRILQDNPPLEMVEILEPMKALTESVIAGEPVTRRPPDPLAGQQLPETLWRREPGQGRALDLIIQPSSTRFFPISGWQTLALTVPSDWADSFEPGKDKHAQIIFEANGVSPTLWVLTAETVEKPDLDRLITKERDGLAGVASPGSVRPLTAPHMQGRSFVADTGASVSAKSQDFTRVYVVVAQAGKLLVTAKIYLQPGSLEPVEQAERILRTLQNRDLTPPKL